MKRLKIKLIIFSFFTILLPPSITLAEQADEPVEAATAVEKEVSSNPKAAKIENKIDGINAEISKLDSENEQLKNTFQQILKKNRALAEQLKEIDEKLTTTN